MLWLNLQNFGYLMQRADLLEKTLMLGKIEGKRRRGWQRLRWLDNITDSLDMNFFSKLRETVKDREAWCAAVHAVTELDMTQQLNNNHHHLLDMHHTLDKFLSFSEFAFSSVKLEEKNAYLSGLLPSSWSPSEYPAPI